MSDLDSFIEDGFTEAEDTLADTFTYLGVNYKGVFNEADIAEELVDGGYLTRLVGQLVVRKTILPSVIIGKTITINSRTFRIINQKEDNVTLSIELQDTNK